MITMRLDGHQNGIELYKTKLDCQKRYHFEHPVNSQTTQLALQVSLQCLMELATSAQVLQLLAEFWTPNGWLDPLPEGQWLNPYLWPQSQCNRADRVAQCRSRGMVAPSPSAGDCHKARSSFTSASFPSLQMDFCLSSGPNAISRFHSVTRPRMHRMRCWKTWSYRESPGGLP